MNKRVFLSVLVLLALFVSFVPSAARAADILGNHSTEGHLIGESDQYEITTGKHSSWPYVMYRYQEGFITDPHITFRFRCDECPVCDAKLPYWHVDKIGISAGVNDYKYNCTACLTRVTYRSYNAAEGASFTSYAWTGNFGSPIIGRTTQVVDGIVDLCSRFASLIVANWLTIIIIAIPLIGVGLAFVIRLIKKNK